MGRAAHGGDEAAHLGEGPGDQRRACRGAEARALHYEKRIADGLSPLQEAQIAMMAMGAAAHFVAGGLKIGAGIASGVPQALIGPFIMGTSVGGDQVGDALALGSEVSSTLGEGFGMTGELLGVRAEQERQEQDWQLQLATSRADIVEIGHRLAGAELEVLAARQVRYVNKSGRAYGFHLENAYVEDRESGRAFFVTAASPSPTSNSTKPPEENGSSYWLIWYAFGMSG